MRSSIALLSGLVLAHIDSTLAQLAGIPTVPFKNDGKKSFKLDAVGTIIVDTKYADATDKSGLTLIPPTLHEFGATFAQDLQQVLNKTVTATNGDKRESNTIFLTIDSEHEFLDAASRPTSEGYTIVAEEDGVTIRGASPLGAWWGTRTLLQQAILGDDGAVPVGQGDDAPGWSTRGMMLDCGRHFYLKEFLIDMCSYISFFKQNTFHIHLSDNTIVPTYTPDNVNETYARFRLWSDNIELSGLNRHANESYTKADFDEIQTKCAQRGVTIIPEIEAPGHCLPIVQWRPQIGFQGDLSLLNISHPDTIPTMKTVWKEFLPWFHTSVVSIGADEYKGPEEDYKKFVNEMSAFINQEASKSIRIWGTFPAVKHAGSSTTIDSNITIQHWAYLFDNPYEDYIKNNYSVINSDEMYYIVMKDGPYGRTINTSTTFTGNPDGHGPWYPNIFNLSHPDQNPSRDNKLVQGAISPLWNDQGANTSVYSEAYYAWRDGIPALADKHWGGNLTQDQYSNWLSKLVAKVPNQNFERRIPSKQNLIFSYDLRKVKGDSITDKSGNKYDAKTTCKTADDGIVMSADCDITTPWSSKGRNYTLSLTLNIDKLPNDKNTTLVSGSDSTLMLTPNVTLFAAGIYFRLNNTIPLQSWVRLEISSAGPKTFASAFNDKGDKIFSKAEFLTEMSYYGAPLRWHEMAIEAPIHQITGWEGKVREFSLTAEGVSDSKQGGSSTTRGLPSIHLLAALCAAAIYLGL
ncbi:Glycoside hydrolase, superfamily [Cordyceps fumosorosea ARSEF 2679]|uniref:beta-N-acetylhexosaminidase n=1 Tax=Cordyceps fumosorosea (strain ARSEF 2679) TaxID=1081104 RepID=A0A167KSW7_CORFA|nr:Glycoside hydrolase, superfamily [Cordyceps fumosorosea ARSEF 2679]OAA52149.1 Glycoside hydrolase, superfamily [Cordyceps fumosorosea ARSEF 2679]